MIPKAFSDALDVLWQASGYDGSPSFDADGNWKPR
jgi:hypothetical protein